MANTLILYNNFQCCKGHLPPREKTVFTRVIINRDGIPMYVPFNKLEKMKLVKYYNMKFNPVIICLYTIYCQYDYVSLTRWCSFFSHLVCLKSGYSDSI